ncbi:MAG: group II intron reverse transcriptase/maturase [Clostridiales bacterium]|nr:group II intron reverse transcriptase/maturase [Clostridiales bacterium]
MTKRIVNRAERNAERYNTKEIGYQLYEGSRNNKIFDRLMPIIISEQNIILAYRNICKNNGSKTPGTDGKTIVEIQELLIETVIKTVRNKLKFYQPKKVRRVEIPKDNGKTRPLGIPSIWDRLIQQCVLQVLEPICEAKFHERNNGFRPHRSTQNAIAQCYKMAQIQNLHFVVDVDITGFFDNIDHSKLIRQLWAMGIRDRKLIMIIKQMLKAEILFNDIVITPETGTPQGGILSPLLANVVLNELDWWIANQWEMFRIKEGSTGYEFPKVDKEGNVITIDRTQKWNKMRAKTKLKEMYIVRYADDFKIFCRDYETAKKVMHAVKLWLAENLHLRTSDEKSGITNLRKNYTTFLGIKFKVVPKGKKWIVRSHIADKSKAKVIDKLRCAWRAITDHSRQSELDRSINLYNSMVMGMHNYYSMATMVSADFAEIGYKVRGKSNGMNHNCRSCNLKKQGEITSKYILEKYGKSKQCRWINERIIVPIGYVTYEYPKYKRRDVNKYVRKYSDVKNCIRYDVMKYMIENAHLYPTLEMADNALSRYISQKGKCAVTHNELTIADMVCEHIKPCIAKRNDTYKNLILLSKEAAELIGAHDSYEIGIILKNMQLTEEMQNKINKLRKYRGLEEIQFKDYTGTNM